MPGLNTIIQDIILKWKHFPCYWPFVWGIQRLLVNSPDKGQWRRTLMFSLICAWINDWVNNREAGDLRCHCTHYDVTVMSLCMRCGFPGELVLIIESLGQCCGSLILSLGITHTSPRDHPHSGTAHFNTESLHHTWGANTMTNVYILLVFLCSKLNRWWFTCSEGWWCLQSLYAASMRILMMKQGI